ncbi:MAG: hypothetical protein COU47_04110 [Candidatus Niyogibacteria bacterium CG10_big_fil_rev_8_21_14_0_10_46_36]|uniref:Uncharacterized protein n=1 Tax=Candidatus Niyogibacteria bacterium CG10_big_fil_rev_8_21_14_0_10_46_36 TaxID=1974726 RepID=A0A2H0TCH3_9BACT|nr:MAG: hypothetical protein COU47_04110 [Candidatus Niyogibacteria bacterium CG10_big_fil_rev_8_21_14_0_10_46_36]
MDYPKRLLTLESVSRGMFSEEKLVSFKDVNGKVASGFYPDGYIQDGSLIVDILSEREDAYLVTVRGMQCGGYGFFQGSNFWVSKDLIGEEVKK